MKCIPKWGVDSSLNLIFIFIFSFFSLLALSQPIHIANSTSPGDNAWYQGLGPNLSIECVNVNIDGVRYDYELIISSPNALDIKIENISIADLLDSGNPRWFEYTEKSVPTYGFYFEEPFSLQVTDLDGTEFTVLNWPDCGECHLVEAIRCVDEVVNGVNYNYDLLLSTNSPEFINIVNGYSISFLLSLNNDRFRQIDENLYAVLFESEINLNIQDCDGNTSSNQWWPSCVSNSLVSDNNNLTIDLTDEIVENQLYKEKKELIKAHVKSSYKPLLIVDVLDDENPVSIFISGITHSAYNKILIEDSYLNEGINELVLDEIPFGVYQIVIQQGQHYTLMKYAHTYE